MHRIICTLLICLTASVFCACSGNGGADDTTGAVPAYKELIATLRSCSADSADRTQCDKHKIWESLDSQTKSQFLDAYAALVKIDRIIETYFDPIEHKYMRTKTGTNVLKEAKIDSYEALFAYLFHPETLKFNANTDSGVEIEKTIVQNDNVVTIQTHYNQQVFTMIRESDGVWRTSGLLAFVAPALDPIFASETAMTEYAKGNLADEMERRTKVRDYFLVQQALKEKHTK